MIRSCIVLLIFLAGHVSAQTADSREKEIVFRDVNVISMENDKVIEGQDVVVKDGKISAIAKRGNAKFQKGALIVEAKGKYLIPGLTEMHAHVPPIDEIAPMKDVLVLFAANGVTTIRGMLGHPRHIELRGKIQSGEILGPRFFTSGPSFNGISVKTPDVAEKMVREQKAAGYDFLKLHPGLTLENFNTIVKTAREVDIPFAGHVSTGVGVWRAIDAGYASIDHLDGFIEGLVPGGVEAMTPQEIGFFGMFVAKKADETQIPKLMQALREHRIWVVPTQCLSERWSTAERTSAQLAAEPEMKYMDQKTIDQWISSKDNQSKGEQYNATDVNNFNKLRRKLILECQRNGVGLVAGSDAPQVFNVPGFSLHHELRYMVDSGLTPYEALKSATVNAAAYFNLSNSGTLKPGNASDMVLLAGNPLTDITQTTHIEGVMLGNKWLSKEFIADELRKQEKR